MLVAAFVTLSVAALLTPVLASWARRRDFLDIPNHRSSHVVAIPRIGGVALVLSVLVGLMVRHAFSTPYNAETMVVIGGAIGVALLGLIDDFRALPAVTRLIVQLVVAIAVVAVIGPVPMPWLGAGGPVAFCARVFWIVTLTNAYNFMDGIDGIAGAQAIVAGIGWVAIGLMAGSHDTTAMGMLLVAASIGFLFHNWHPARVFLGDAGSGFMGFVFAAFPLITSGGTHVWWCAALLMWPFLFDAGFTLLRRARRGEDLLSAHRSHIYQRLVITGLSHSLVTVIYAGLAALGLAAALAVQSAQPVAAAAAGAAIVVAGAVLWRCVTRREAASVPPATPSASGTPRDSRSS